MSLKIDPGPQVAPRWPTRNGHRRSSPIRSLAGDLRAWRPSRRARWLPWAAAWATIAVGVLNVISALTVELPDRVNALLAVAPDDAILGAHALALPFGLALVVIGVHLGRRRRRAMRVAIALLAVIGGLDLLKGLDVEEALLSWTLAGLLAWGRDAFCVRLDDRALSPALGRVALLVGAGLISTAMAVVVAVHASGVPTLAAAGHDAVGLLTLSGSSRFPDPFSWLPLAIGALGGATLVAGAAFLLAPRRGRSAKPDRAARSRALALVRSHGTDTLSFFKLRSDLSYMFSDDGQAFLAYRIEAGVLLVAGDPVADEHALPDLLLKLNGFAEARGLRIGVVGASEHMASLRDQTGLRALYLGDEAIVETATFSLEGRRIRKVRQATHRLAKAGYRTELRIVGEMTPAELDELEAISARWRDGADERGFAMAMDTLRGDHLADSVVVLARDDRGAVRGFLHFVPAYGRAALSLSLMRRDRDTPNGLTELLVVRAIELTRDRGVEELSLNFAAFARLLYRPATAFERVLGRLVALTRPVFKVESLYSFSSKFAPRWEARYLLYESARALPRTGLATLWAEGQLPRPRTRAYAP